MLNLINSEFYKLFRRKAFYICAIIVAILSALDVFTIPYQIEMQYGISDLDLKMFGYNGLFVLTRGAGQVALFSSIFVSLFVASEFSTGMVRNILIRGVNRFYFYFSKLIVSLTVPFMYTILACLVSFLVGTYLWGPGDLTQEITSTTLNALGAFVVVQFVLHSLYVMIGFVLRNTGATVAVNLGLVISLISNLLISGWNFILRHWFGVSINIAKYWIGNYINVYQFSRFPHDLLMLLTWVSLSYLVVACAVGSLTFWKREIK
ncbi:MAG: ABC transporter permease [Firmicutes bacterium]|nr:ABC transporter permease [Bacillota bacterium]